MPPKTFFYFHNITLSKMIISSVYNDQHNGTHTKNRLQGSMAKIYHNIALESYAHLD